MTKPAAFQATYADWRLVKGRKVCQIILEVPLEAANSVLDVLGGMPDPAQSLWLGVARLNTELPDVPPEAVRSGNPSPGTDGRKPGTQSKPWASMSPAQQAGILCDDDDFSRFLADRYVGTHDPVEFVRDFCGVKSRKDIANNPKARVLWHQLVEEYRVWQRYPELAES